MTTEPLSPERLDELVRRCEAADASEQRELLTEAFFALFPSPHFEPDWEQRGNPFREWQDRETAFKRMLNAEAYESAALTLVPEDFVFTVANWWCEGDERPPFFADCARLSALQGGGDAPIEQAWAATPALALTAAALRARAKEANDGNE